MKRLIPYVLLGLLSVPVIITMAPEASMFGGIDLSMTPAQVRQASFDILTAEQIDVTALRPEIRLRSRQSHIRQVHAEYGLEEGNEILRSWFGGYRWVARWSAESGIQVSTSGSDQEEQVEQVRSWLEGDARVEFDSHGRLLEFARDIPDTVELPSVPSDSAQIIVRNFLASLDTPSLQLGGTTLLALASDSIVTPRPQELDARTDHLLEWKLVDTITSNEITVKAKVSGPFVSELDVSVTVPQTYSSDTIRTVTSLTEALAFVILFITIIVVSFKRFRAYEIGFKVAVTIGIVTGIGLGIKLYTMLAPNSGWELFIPLLFGPLFYGGGAILVWAAAESSVREAWREKAVTLDLLTNGFVTHSRIGRSIVRGVSLGLIMTAAGFLFTSALNSVTHVGLAFSEDSIYDFIASSYPSLTLLLEGFYTQVYTVAFFLMFLGSWIYKKTGNKFFAGAVIVIVLTAMRGFMYEPVWAGLLLTSIPYAIAAYAFIRYDVLTVFVALIITIISSLGSVLAASPAGFYTEAVVVLGVMLGIVLLTGIISQFRKDVTVDIDSITPAYSKHITERERLQHELAIARNVQMSFLPKANPVVSSLDIASRCAPALEVGGDYYDFIELPDGQLGVAVGDVSGKGTQAAFFMTLTKGFLRALARVSHAPGTVLNEVNKLFYENVERGTFISLIYGVFDTMRSRLTIARAGHNPVILRKSAKRDTQVLNPMGLALGLDKGDVFAQSVKEVSVEYERGDVFVFYTDGISEAMNDTREEYGEDRLSTSIEAHAHRPASEILEGILQDMHTFVGKAEQHDDVTLVVVKIT